MLNETICGYESIYNKSHNKYVFATEMKEWKKHTRNNRLNVKQHQATRLLCDDKNVIAKSMWTAQKSHKTNDRSNNNNINEEWREKKETKQLWKRELNIPDGIWWLRSPLAFVVWTSSRCRGYSNVSCGTVLPFASSSVKLPTTGAKITNETNTKRNMK